MSKHQVRPADVSPDPALDKTPSVDDREPEQTDPAHRAALEAGLADMRARRIASAAEIEAAYARFGRIAR